MEEGGGSQPQVHTRSGRVAHLGWSSTCSYDQATLCVHSLTSFRQPSYWDYSKRDYKGFEKLASLKHLRGLISSHFPMWWILFKWCSWGHGSPLPFPMSRPQEIQALLFLRQEAQVHCLSGKFLRARCVLAFKWFRCWKDKTLFIPYMTSYLWVSLRPHFLIKQFKISASLRWTWVFPNPTETFDSQNISDFKFQAWDGEAVSYPTHPSSVTLGTAACPSSSVTPSLTSERLRGPIVYSIKYSSWYYLSLYCSLMVFMHESFISILKILEGSNHILCTTLHLAGLFWLQEKWIHIQLLKIEFGVF